MNLTLYHYWRSSCSWRVRWALALKAIPYEAVAVNILAGEHQTPAYKAKNPSGFLPALAINGRFFGESLAIIDWLEEHQPRPALYPSDPLAKLHVRQLALTIASGTQPLANPSVISHFVPQAEARAEHVQYFIRRGLEVYESLLTQGQAGRFSYGDDITVADLCLIPQVYNAERFAVDLSAMPRVRAIYAACLATPACDQAAPDKFAPPG